MEENKEKLGRTQIVEIKKTEIIEVIRIVAVEGDGTEKSPIKLVEYYWGKDGRYIGKLDPSLSRAIDVRSTACK